MAHLASTCDHAVQVCNEALADGIFGIETDKLLSSAILVWGVITGTVAPTGGDSGFVEAVIDIPTVMPLSAAAPATKAAVRVTVLNLILYLPFYETSMR